jgi:hypothetical protein
MDTNILTWLKAQPTDWQREINNGAVLFHGHHHRPGAAAAGV